MEKKTDCVDYCSSSYADAPQNKKPSCCYRRCGSRPYTDQRLANVNVVFYLHNFKPRPQNITSKQLAMQVFKCSKLLPKFGGMEFVRGKEEKGVRLGTTGQRSSNHICFRKHFLLPLVTIHALQPTDRHNTSGKVSRLVRSAKNAGSLHKTNL